MELELDDTSEGFIAIAAAIVVILTAMADQMLLSLGLSVGFLCCLAAYRLLHAHYKHEKPPAKEPKKKE
ncbi:MAG: hypothetical protein ABIG39_06005 [Candidatus Micrarchaeota archaeon]